MIELALIGALAALTYRQVRLERELSRAKAILAEGLIIHSEQSAALHRRIDVLAKRFPATPTA